MPSFLYFAVLFLDKANYVVVKEIVFDVRSKPTGRIVGAMKDNEENLNKFSYSKDFEINSAGVIPFDVYYVEVAVPAEFLGIEGKLQILLNENKFYESNISDFTAGANVIDINHVITKGHKLSAVLEYTNAKSLGHYTLHIKLEAR